MSENDESGTVGSAEEAAETMVDMEPASGLGEILPEPLQPLYRPIEAVQEFRRAHSGTYIKIMEAIVAIMLTGGYVWWMYLFITG